MSIENFFDLLNNFSIENTILSVCFENTKKIAQVFVAL